jgi:hypothetical protein
MRSRTSLSCAIGLVAVTTVLTVASVAQGWSRPASFAVSSPDGGKFQICRDGIIFQIAWFDTDIFRYKAYSPNPQIEFPGGPDIIVTGTVVAKGSVRPQPSSRIVDGEYNHIGTVTRKWEGGQLLQPSPDAVALIINTRHVVTDGPYGIEDCYLFPPKTKSQCKKGGWRRWAFGSRTECIAYIERQASEACLTEREAGSAEFRAKYGTGNHRRHALRNCVRETT